MGAEEVSADFTIEETSADAADIGLVTETDTAYSNRNIRFTAKIEDAEYKWYIGNEILSTKQVSRYFPNSLVENQSIPIQLVVRKK